MRTCFRARQVPETAGNVKRSEPGECERRGKIQNPVNVSAGGEAEPGECEHRGRTRNRPSTGSGEETAYREERQHRVPEPIGSIFTVIIEKKE